MSSDLTARLWAKIDPTYQSICEHPFIRELAAGTLNQDRFVFYLQQDALYLIDFARALAHTAARLQSVKHTEEFLIFSQGALVAERALHNHYFQIFNVLPGEQQHPACFYYTHYLLATVSHRTVEEAVAALLPCFWIYAEVGKYIAANTVLSNPYQEWITMYSSEEFDEGVKKAREITDILATDANPKIQVLMEHAFVRSSQLEWLFWDSAYRQEQWTY